jgi:hypothetical protein
MTARPNEPFADAVAKRAGASTEDVIAVLDKHSVVASPQPPPAKSLRVLRIGFCGEKKTEDGCSAPFVFDWDVSGPGLWILASDDNLVGKSTVLQVALWALRGRPKRLTSTVRGWIREVEVSFQADRTQVVVAFRLDGERPVGTVRLTVGAMMTELSFEDAEQFKRTMQDIMLEALGLEPISGSRMTPDGRVATQEDGWLAYTGAFLMDPDSDAIMGEAISGTDLQQRLLQVYLGLPWATTLFQARSRSRQLEAESDMRRRRVAAFGNRSLDELEEDFTDVQRRIRDEGARSKAARELAEAQAHFDGLAERVRQARRGADGAAEGAAEAKALELRTERGLLAIREERAAASFLRRLSPVCCPRCDRPIDEGRQRMERSERRCSVCTGELPSDDSKGLEGEIAAAEERYAETKRIRTDAAKAALKTNEEYDRLRAELVQAGDRLQSASTTGTAADAQNLARQAARLEGMLDIARSLSRADGTTGAELVVLKAAVEEANERVKASGEAVLSAVSDEVTRLVGRLGMRGVSRVVLKRNAHVDVHQAGRVVIWGGLAPGEQLRLRLATVIALVRAARAQGYGRHPGLLLIDSPGSQEMKAARVSDFLGELATLAEETEGLQIFVAMQGLEKVNSIVEGKRMKACGPGEFLW